MKKFTQSLAAAALALASSVANAGFVPGNWSDSIDFYPDPVITSTGPSFSYTHDIRDNGFVVGRDYITDFVLALGFRDDSLSDGTETIRVNLLGTANDACFTTSLSDSWLCTYRTTVRTEGIYSASPITQAVVSLSNTGLLAVTISSSRGDFALGSSQLTADGVTVPEPGSLALLGLGLVGLGVAARRRKQA